MLGGACSLGSRPTPEHWFRESQNDPSEPFRAPVIYGSNQTRTPRLHFFENSRLLPRRGSIRHLAISV